MKVDAQYALDAQVCIGCTVCILPAMCSGSYVQWSFFTHTTIMICLCIPPEQKNRANLNCGQVDICPLSDDLPDLHPCRESGKGMIVDNLGVNSSTMTIEGQVRFYVVGVV